ncbi:zinc-binding dehydrogenase [Rhodococcus sp. WAY2]|uniref:zinc-binding dehydrogenase n=1 Tax=Rhodococcus sp. WAY2 TaxID=2663121 RepID=UPI00131F7E93|nr:zinc-binding dehydrogenase [Rhodococcus sp. WAY2]QHE73225.1 Alcohol dehydrogenase [Rhodococcus sp. WAY2]
MKAWMFHGPGTQLELVDVPDPTPAPGEVVVDLKAAGLCHSDVGITDGTLTEVLGFTPIILGHEASGVVSAIGEGVTTAAIGDRVAISAMGDGTSGVIGQKTIGIGRHGAYAQKHLTPASELIPIPDEVPFVQAAAATDAGMTSYHGVFVRGGLQPGMKVGIIGLGGLGLTGARMAVLAGAEVYAAEINTDVHAAGLERGVKHVVNDVTELAPFELDLIVDFAGFGTTTAGAIEAVRHGGRIVQVGVGQQESTINTYLLAMKDLQLVGSVGGTPADTVEVIKYIASGGLTIATRTIGFDDIPAGLDEVARGVKGHRLVATIGD